LKFKVIIQHKGSGIVNRLDDNDRQEHLAPLEELILSSSFLPVSIFIVASIVNSKEQASWSERRVRMSVAKKKRENNFVKVFLINF
jgi:hypothetical protein